LKVLVEADAPGGMTGGVGGGGGGVLVDERSVSFVEAGESGDVGVREEMIGGPVGSVVAGGVGFERVGERS